MTKTERQIKKKTHKDEQWHRMMVIRKEKENTRMENDRNTYTQRGRNRKKKLSQKQQHRGRHSSLKKSKQLKQLLDILNN